ncbi:pfh1 [Symbiodinium natans]|uniref:Pfh1 protein n=1 Tax=Symbiodinium natans TaxID=878477 RepID=A0A812LJS8_9DINO|nr:pfh1 [Symbiodinium natans]
MSESMEEDHSIQASEQDDYQEQIKEYELEQAMLEAEFVMHEMARWESDPIEKAIMMQDAQDQKMFQQEMELEKRMAKMQVQYRNMDGQMLHCSRPCPIVPERFGSYREAELAELHARNNNESDVTLSLQELRSRRKRAGKPTPAQFLENRPPREVLLHDLDASHVGPICLETTKLVCGSDLITDAWAWLDLLSRADDNDVVCVQIVFSTQI